MATGVSVVVPVYNPGRYLDACVASIRRQTIGPDALEVIFVDDGSTDGSGARLDRLAESEPNVRVIHIPNSGWPGRPRNLGLDAAAGEYVLFLDADDWLGEEAAERMAAMADRTGADVVVGREVGHGRGVPRELFRQNLDGASLEQDPLVRLMTPHKMFRRSMLVEHNIRFPEGRRRFEDHVFVLRSYFAARRISVLADYACYHWVTRADHGNASDQYADPAAYYRDLRDVFDVIDAHVPPGPMRDRLTAHWYRRRCLDRLSGERWTDAPAAHDRAVFDAVRDLASERIGPGVVAALPMSHRLRSAAVTAGRPDLLIALARVEHGLRARVRVRGIDEGADRVRLSLVADLFDASAEPIRFRREGGDRLDWDPPPTIAAEAFPREDLHVTRDLDATSVSVVLRDGGGIEHDVPAAVERIVRETPGGPVLSIRARAEIDARRAAAGSPLGPGDWDLLADVQACGWHSLRRLGSAGASDVRRPLALRVERDGRVAVITIGDPPASLPATPVRRPAGRHAVERYVPAALLRRLPMGLRRTGKQMLMRLRRRP